MIHHTGYVAPTAPIPGLRNDTVLVSTGGGTLGRYLVKTAILAAKYSERPWHILVGGADADELVAAIGARPDRLLIEPARADYPDLLAAAACSVSLCGYNTAVELAGLTTPAILVPSAEGGEQEQTLRANALARNLGIEVIAQQDLTPQVLAEIADALAAGPPRPQIALTADDGTKAIVQIETMLAART